MTYALSFEFEGQLSNAANSLIYTPPAGVISTTVKTMIVTNVTGADVTINLYARKGAGTSRRVWDKDYVLAAGQSRSLTLNIVLNANDSLRGDASSAGAIDYVGMAAVQT